MVARSPRSTTRSVLGAHLAGTRPVAPGRIDDNLPDHDAATMDRLFSHPMPDWSDQAAVAEFAAAGAEILGDDPAASRATAERIWDRTPGTEPAVQMANQMGMVFSKLDCKPRWPSVCPSSNPGARGARRRDPFFPVGNGETLAREIPGARLLVLERAATAIPDVPPVRSPRRCLSASPAYRDEVVNCGGYRLTKGRPLGVVRSKTLGPSFRSRLSCPAPRIYR